MAYCHEDLRVIFAKTDGRCHICWKSMRFGLYGLSQGWEVEHSNPLCNGGTDRLCNLFPAHVICNREKGSKTTRTARSWHGRNRAPLSRKKKEQIKSNNRWGLGTLGGFLGLFAGLPGVIVGITIGALVGDSIDPEGA